jgi:hypothetical protein
MMILSSACSISSRNARSDRRFHGRDRSSDGLGASAACCRPSWRRCRRTTAGTSNRWSVSASLFFATRPRRALLGDFNEELMHTYRAIRCHPRLVSRAASSWGDDSATYYEVRSLSAVSLDPIQPAARFTYLNRYSFNGVYRTNKEGRFNVPRGRDTGSLPSEADSIGAR